MQIMHTHYIAYILKREKTWKSGSGFSRIDCPFMCNNERYRNALKKMQYVCIIQCKFSLAHTYIIKCRYLFILCVNRILFFNVRHETYLMNQEIL